MNFSERVKQYKEEEAVRAIKLKQDITYEATIKSGSLTEQDKTDYKMITLKLLIDAPVDSKGKDIKVNYVIDENTKNKLQGKIGMDNWLMLLDGFGVNLEKSGETEDEQEEFSATEARKLKGKKVTLTVTYNVDKKDSAKVFPNYKIKAVK